MSLTQATMNALLEENKKLEKALDRACEKVAFLSNSPLVWTAEDWKQYFLEAGE